MIAQGELFPAAVPAPAPPASFLERHGLRVDVTEIPNGNFVAAYVGPPPKSLIRTIGVVHVMSPHAGGEIRGYMIVDGELRLRLPAYSGAWTEMDEAVSAHLGMPVRPYAMQAESGGGWAVERPAKAAERNG